MTATPTAATMTGRIMALPFLWSGLRDHRVDDLLFFWFVTKQIREIIHAKLVMRHIVQFAQP
jgi:hypothetical protein